MKERRLDKLEDYGDLLLPTDLRKILGIGMNKVYELLQANEIPHLRIGRVIRIPKCYVLEYIEKCTAKKDENQ